jgi:UDP-N-acetylmuramate--alanine ligase
MTLPPANPLPDLDGLQLHLMGIRGQGMKPFALAAQARGAHITGCDLRKADPDPDLAAAGISVASEHDPAHAVGTHLVVSTSILSRFDEPGAAAARGALHHRSELLDALLRDRKSVAVTGTHGKGTVAALLGAALVALDVDPTVLVGAPVPQFAGPIRIGAGPIVAEADDADGSIARVHADISIVTNSWFDHPVMGRSRRETMDAIADHVRSAAQAVVLGKDPKLDELVDAATASVRRVGRDVTARTVSATAEEWVVRLREPGGITVDAPVHYLGGGLVDNVAVAYLALRTLGYGPDESARALGELRGIDRRLNRVGTANGVSVYDDLGKHPAAVAANLRVLRRVTPGAIHVMYEPFLHTDLVRWQRDWARVFAAADTVTVLPIDPAPGYVDEPVASPTWPSDVGLDATVVESRDQGVATVSARATPGDAVIVMGYMSDLTDVARRVLDTLRAPH